MIAKHHQPASHIQPRFCVQHEYPIPSLFLGFPRSLALGPDSDQRDFVWDAGEVETGPRKQSITL